MRDVLIDWKARFGDRPLGDHAAMNAGMDGDTTMPAPGVLEGDETVTAVVNAGRWIAECPFCAGAEYVNFDSPVFFCCNCRNQEAGNRPIPVALPTDTVRVQVAAYLCVRPRENRNWMPDETVADLRAENKRAGLRLA